MSIFVDIKREQSKGVDMVGTINIFIEEKNDEADALNSMGQLKEYYRRGTLFALLLNNVIDDNKLRELISMLNEVFPDGYIIAKKEGTLKMKVIHINIKFMKFRYI